LRPIRSLLAFSLIVLALLCIPTATRYAPAALLGLLRHGNVDTVTLLRRHGGWDNRRDLIVLTSDGRLSVYPPSLGHSPSADSSVRAGQFRAIMAMLSRLPETIPDSSDAADCNFDGPSYVLTVSHAGATRSYSASGCPIPQPLHQAIDTIYDIARPPGLTTRQ
jgi:hypothetical protein